ncbi:MAG TPA: hypothetical protein VN745_02570 [Verrucomicrobiae bacterium]|nr:hypothetical protein [Verrucomicrobiae bacterium]
MNRRSNWTQTIAGVLGMAVLMLASASFAPRTTLGAAQLSDRTARAFDKYIHDAEMRSEADLAATKGFLWIDAMPIARREQAYAELRGGQILIHRNNACGAANCAAVPGGLIHDWTGIVFARGISLPEALAKLQDYGRDADYYKPEVLQSKLLQRTGGDFRVFLRLKETEIITVILDTEYDIRYARLDGTHAYSRSYSRRIAEIENAGTAKERAHPAGKGHGFLWQLDSYWHFYQADGGVYIQCRAISLTRDIPTGLGWLVGPFIEKIPQKSLRETLEQTRAALATKKEKGK